MRISLKELPIKKIISYIGLYLGIIIFLAVWWNIRMSRTLPRQELIIPAGKDSVFTASFSEIHRIGLSYEEPSKQDVTENGIMTDVSVSIADSNGNVLYEKELTETQIGLFDINIDEGFDEMPVILNLGEEYRINYSGTEIEEGLLTIALYGRESSLLPLFIFASVMVLIIVSLCLFGLSKTEGLLNLKLFFLILGLMSFMMTIILPPYSVQDEIKHFGMSYSISSRMLGLEAVDADRNVYLYQNGLASVEWCDTAQNEYHFWNFDYGSDPVKCVNSMVRENDSLQKQAYFIPAIGITIARLLNAPYQIVLLSGRIMNLLLFLFVGYFSLRLMKVYRDSIKAILLFPSIVWMACSYSYDNWNLVFSLAFFAYIIYLKYREKQVSIVDIIVLSVILYLLVPIKFIYFLMGIGILLLSRSNFKNRIWQWATYLWTMGFGFFVAIIYRGMSASSFMGSRIDERSAVTSSVNEATGTVISTVVERQSFSLEWIFASKRNLLYTIQIVINTLFDQTENYLYKIVDGEYLDVRVPSIVIFGILFLSVIIMLDECGEQKVSVKDRLVALATTLIGSAAVLATFLFIYSFVHVTEIGTIGGVQGRYFLPFFLFIPLFVRGGFVKLQKDRARYAMCLEILLVVFTIMLSLSAITRR